MKCEACGLEKLFDGPCDTTSDDKTSNVTFIGKMREMSLPIAEKGEHFLCLSCKEVIDEEYQIYLNDTSSPSAVKKNIRKCELASTGKTEIENPEVDLAIHQLGLTKLCRVCKSTKLNHVRSEAFYDKTSELITNTCKILSMNTFENEDADRYPAYLCHKCYLLFSKAHSNLAAKKTVTKFVCASFSPHKANCDTCCLLQEKDLTLAKPDQLTHKTGLSSQWIHFENLSKLCRICGKFIGKRQISKFSDFLQQCMKTLYSFKFESEDPNIYPLYVCNICSNKMNTYCFQANHNVQVTAPKIFEFKPHSNNCDVCSNCTEIKGDLDTKPDYNKRNSDVKSVQAKCNGSLYRPNDATLYFHKEKLKRYCRICGLPSVEFHGDRCGRTKLPEGMNKLINFAFNLDMQQEDQYVYPPAICNKCFIKLNIGYNLQLQMEHNLVRHLTAFTKHEENCAVCSQSIYDIDSYPVVPVVYDDCEKQQLEFSSYRTSGSNIEQFLLHTTFKKRIESDKALVYGLPGSQLVSVEMVDKLVCGGCGIVPLSPLKTNCHHVICEHCIISVFEVDHKCLNNCCGETLNPDKVWRVSSEDLGSSKFNCKNAPACQFIGSIEEVMRHQLLCTETVKGFEVPMINYFRKTNPSCEARATETKVQRSEADILDQTELLRCLNDDIDRFCNNHSEDRTAILRKLVEHYKTELENIHGKTDLFSNEIGSAARTASQQVETAHSSGNAVEEFESDITDTVRDIKSKKRKMEGLWRTTTQDATITDRICLPVEEQSTVANVTPLKSEYSSNDSNSESCDEEALCINDPAGIEVMDDDSYTNTQEVGFAFISSEMMEADEKSSETVTIFEDKKAPSSHDETGDSLAGIHESYSHVVTYDDLLSESSNQDSSSELLDDDTSDTDSVLQPINNSE